MIPIKPILSICCLTYNHESYIREAIEGFLMQKTTFMFEIIVHDDASTDKTTEIVKEYSDKYPDLIVPIFQTQNQYSKGDSLMLKFVLPKAQGKYIAICEGDDYWTDPYKLQKQIDFLEANPDYGLVHTNCVAEIDGIIQPHKYEAPIRSGFNFEELLTHKFFICTLTVCARKKLVMKCKESLKEKSSERKWKMGDYPLWLEMALHTKFKFINDITAFYRILPESASHSKDKRKQYEFLMSVFDIKFFFMNREKVGQQIEEKIFEQYYNTLIKYPKYNRMESLKGIIYLIKRKKTRFKDILQFIKYNFN